MESTTLLKIAGLLFGFIGFTVSAVGMGTGKWIDSILVEIGPFCSNTIGTAVEAVEAMTLMGEIMAGFGLCLGFVTILPGQNQITVGQTVLGPKATGGCFTIAGFIMYIGVIIWGTKVYSLLKVFGPLGYSFYLCCAGGSILLVGGLLFFLSARGSQLSPNQTRLIP
ncbi:uncharacterized protein LOC101859097 [Aplysia californica]|uniref:Uncharacterized protein LOC101859097 n=1 Tax=Aplysia californica TaxID=6500 RepID=A0ABM0JM28_APLCA|nr:uncharacterized protein LOC101859097 [Aplysia californica]